MQTNRSRALSRKRREAVTLKGRNRQPISTDFHRRRPENKPRPFDLQNPSITPHKRRRDLSHISRDHLSHPTSPITHEDRNRTFISNRSSSSDQGLPLQGKEGMLCDQRRQCRHVRSFQPPQDTGKAMIINRDSLNNSNILL